MKKMFALVLSLVMLLALAACGRTSSFPGGGFESPSAPAQEENAGSFPAPAAPEPDTAVGTWELTQRTVDGADAAYENRVLLTLEEGGTGFVSDEGAEEEVSWDESSIKLYDRTVTYTISGDTLRFNSENMSFVFTRLSREPYTRQSGVPANVVEDDPSLPAAADFTLKDRSGNIYHLSDFYGMPIIINFWATWCGPCQSELPYFNSAYLAYGDQIQFLMVDMVDGSYETEEGTCSFVDGNGYLFPLFFDYAGEGITAYEVSAIPFTVVINANGRIVETHTGAMSAEELQELIDKLL